MHAEMTSTPNLANGCIREEDKMIFLVKTKKKRNGKEASL
jgi:hypothetical protein